MIAYIIASLVTWKVLLWRKKERRKDGGKNREGTRQKMREWGRVEALENGGLR